MKTITIKITDLDYKVLEDELVDPEQWVEAALNGKIDKVKTRVVAAEIEFMKADPKSKTIPASDDGILKKRFAREGYKNRAQRRDATPDPEI